MELGKRIRQLRFRAGMTQEQLAEILGVVPQSVSKWENGASMPDITALPLLAETFGVSIDDLFGLSVPQRLNRIENRMDAEEELPPDVFRDFEEFLKGQLASEEHRDRAAGLLSYLYWHRMNSFAKKTAASAKEVIRTVPDKKDGYWELGQAERHAVWDWNLANHTKAIDFYREVAETNPGVPLPVMHLIDNLLADHRAEEAEQWLDRYCAMEGAHPVMKRVYRAYVALARFDEPTADRIMEQLLAEQPEDSAVLFEAAQYYAAKCDYDRALDCYERAFEKDPQRPRFMDALMGIADIHEIRRDYRKAADAYGRIVDLLENEWVMNRDEETELQKAVRERDRLLAKA